MRTRHIVIKGPFTDDEVGQFIALLRQIDMARPSEVFVLDVIDPDGSMDRGEQLLREALPPLHDRATEFARLAYRDDSHPERECDLCCARYRGPAIYCSLECAVADA